MIGELNREQGVTIVLTTHVMEEAEELCGEIALLRQGELIAYQPMAELTRSLHLARPITIIARPAESVARLVEEAPSSPEWKRELARLPGATGAAIATSAPTVPSTTSTISSARSDVSAREAREARMTLTVESLDLRATTPALLAWVRARGLALVSMRAEPVTLTEVFTALTRRQQPLPQASADSVDSGERRG